MEELYIPVIVLTNETEEGDLYYAGSKCDLADDLENNSFVEFYAKTKDGRGSTTMMIRSDDISIIEVDDQNVLQPKDWKHPNVDTKIIDFTNALEKIGRDTQKKIEVEEKNPVKEEPEAKPVDGSMWKNADFDAVSDKLKSVLKAEFPHNDAADRLYDDLVCIAMDAAEAVAFFFNSKGDKKGSRTIAYYVGESVRSWMQSMRFDANLIASAANDPDIKDYVLDDIFTTTLDAIEKSAKG